MELTRRALRTPLMLGIAAVLAFSTLGLAKAGQWLEDFSYSGCTTTVFAGAVSTQASAWQEDINNCVNLVYAKAWRYTGSTNDESPWDSDPYFAYAVRGGTTVYGWGDYVQGTSGVLTSPYVYP